MRIVQIGPYPLERGRICGGVEASVFGLAQEQSRHNEVHVFDVPRIEGVDGVEHDGEVCVHRFRNTGRRQVSTSRQVKRMAEEICVLRPDICHIHGTGLFSWLMYKKLKGKKQKTIVTVHGLVRIEKRNILKKGLTLKRIGQYLYQGQVEKRLLSQLPIAIVDTEYVKDMVGAYPIHKKPVMHVVPQGIDEDYFTLHCSNDSDVFLSVGAIAERKGHLLTLKSFEQLRKAGVRARLVIAGTVASQLYLELLQKAIRESEYREDVILHTDLSGRELKALYGEARVFVLHTEEESQGIVFSEAMATGLPVVSTRVGGVPYVVEHGNNGLLSSYGDLTAFSQNMQCLLDDAGKWQAMSKAAKTASQKYHWMCICERIMQLYRSV